MSSVPRFYWSTAYRRSSVGRAHGDDGAVDRAPPRRADAMPRPDAQHAPGRLPARVVVGVVASIQRGGGRSARGRVLRMVEVPRARALRAQRGPGDVQAARAAAARLRRRNVPLRRAAPRARRRRHVRLGARLLRPGIVLANRELRRRRRHRRVPIRRRHVEGSDRALRRDDRGRPGAFVRRGQQPRRLPGAVPRGDQARSRPRSLPAQRHAVLGLQPERSGRRVSAG